MNEKSNFPEENHRPKGQQKTRKKKPKSLFKKINSEDFSDMYDVRKLFLGIQRHILLILIMMMAWGLLGGYATYKFLTTYEAEAIVLYQEEERTSKNIEGGFTIINLSMATVLDMIKLPKHFESVKTTLGLDLEPGAKRLLQLRRLSKTYRLHIHQAIPRPSS